MTTPHGVVATPAFIPVGTLATVKGLTPADLRQAGASIILANTYHLMHHPGSEIIAELGGLAAFSGWNGPTLTDSGGFQVFSLSATRRLTDDGVHFRSIYDGRTVFLTPAETYRIQKQLDADLIVALDECPPYPSTPHDVARAVDITTRWARQFMQQHQACDNGRHAPLLVVQGGVFQDLRRSSAEALAALEPFGFGIGGLSVGEPREEMLAAAETACEVLPDDRPRHLMGVGTPADILDAVAVGVDLFDCVLPTRNGRNGQAFTSSGTLNLRNVRFRRSRRPLDENCNCYCCRTFSRAYIHHMFRAGEMLGPRMLSLHNVTYYLNLMNSARTAIQEGRFFLWSESIQAAWRGGDLIS